MRSAALLEFFMRWDLQSSPGSRAPTHTWRHPAAGNEIKKRLGSIMMTPGPWRVTVLDAARSDHVALLAKRAGRAAERWRAPGSRRS